jgi:predicted transcriptional regulator
MGRSTDWEAWGATERAQEVSELYFRGLSHQAIAKQLGARPSEIKHYIEIIQMSAYKSEMMDAFFENLQQRTMEHLAALDSQIAIAYQELDYARERVVQVSQFGTALAELDIRSGQPTGKIMLGPRHAAAIPKLLKQLEVLHKQKAEVLKIVGQKSDMTIKLQISHQVQTVILEYIQTLSPDIYAELYRQIEAIVPDSQALTTTLEGNFREVSAA